MLGGALSGGVMAGGSIAINAYQNGKLVNEGLKAPEGSEIRKVAEQMKTELNAGQKVSQAEYVKLGQLIHANTQFRDILNTELNEQKNTASAGETVNIRTLLNETEEQKSARLSGAEITVTESTHDNSKEFSPVKNIKLKISEAKKLLLPIMEKLGISPSQYSNSALDIEFHYSRSGAGRSIAHQFSETNGDYVDFAKVQSSLKELCQNAYPLEAHFDEKPKTADNHVTGVVTLASVLRTSEGIVPVRMTVKFYDNTNPRLHVVINQAISESGSTFIHDEWTQSAHISTENAPATMTITDFFKLVNGSEEFTKRIPDSITGKHFDNAKSAPYNEGKASRREENYGGEEIHLREGGKRLDRESAGESVRSMAKETGGAESRYEKAESGDGEEAQRVVGRKVTPAELGIKNGSRTETVYVVDGEDSEYLRSLKAEAKKRGLNLTLFAGNNLTIGNKSARGYINGDRVYVRIDHPQFRAEQILRHEIGHDKIAKGEIDLVKVKAETRRKAERLFGKNGIDRISEKYASAYDGMTAEEAFEEMVCDALGEMNVFADELSRRYYEAYEAFLAELREKARGSKFNNRDRPSTTLIANVTPAKYSSQAEVLGLDVDWMNDFSSIKDQLLKHREDINSMKPVAEVEYVHGSKETVVDSIMDQLPYIGGPNIKNSGVSFVFDIEGAKSISTHAKTDEVKAAAIAAPYAAKYGKLIAGQKNHEKTGLTTLTFGAPVIINGMPVIVGVAIQFQKNGRPRAVNVELQDGEKSKIRKIEAPRGTRSRVNRYSQGTTLLTRNASESKILQSPGKVNTASLEKGTAGIDLPETGRTSREITGSNTREAGKSSGAAKEKFSSAKRGSNRGRSIETATMENNRFERLRNYGDALPTAWYAYTFDYFYVYINRSFMDYRVIAKIPNTEENGELFSYLERELESDAYGAAGRYIRMVTSSIRRQRNHNSNNDSPEGGGAADNAGRVPDGENGQPAGYSGDIRESGGDLSENGRTSRERKWTPKLNDEEWSIVKSVDGEELKTRGTMLYDTTGWIYKTRKGYGAFVLYSLDDDTVLYASGGERAIRNREYIKERYENGRGSRRNNETLGRVLDDLERKSSYTAFDRPDAGGKLGSNAEDVPLSTGSQGGGGRGDTGHGVRSGGQVQAGRKGVKGSYEIRPGKVKSYPELLEEAILREKVKRLKIAYARAKREKEPETKQVRAS